MLSESVQPAVAHGAGDGLYLGNSMPIRDMDMYAASPAAAREGAGAPGFGVVGSGGCSCSLMLRPWLVQPVRSVGPLHEIHAPCEKAQASE